MARVALVGALLWPMLAPAASAQEAAPAQDSGQGGVIEVDQTGTDEQAKAHFRVGKSLYDSGRFSEAAAEWQRSYELSRRPELLYNIYVAHRDANDTPAATEALRAYLTEAQIEPARRVNLEARLRSLEEAAAAAATSSEEPAPAAGGEPAPATEPGAEDTTGAVELDGDDAVLTDVLPYALLGVGGAMLVAGTVTGLMTLSKVSEVEDECPGEVCPGDFNLDGRRDNVEELAFVTDVFIIGGVAMAGVGTVLLLMDDTEAAPASEPPVAALGCGPTGCMASVRGRF